MNNNKLFILLLLFSSTFCPAAMLNPEEYRLFLFNHINQVNKTNQVDIVLSDNGQDEHSYTANKGDSLNWVNIDRLYTTSLYSNSAYHFARITQSFSPQTGAKWEGTLKLEYVNYCDDPGHNHPNRTVNCNVLCLYDETGDYTINEPLATLTPNFTWGTGIDYTEGVLWFTNWHDYVYCDTDVWELKRLEINKVYCIELKTLESVSPDLELELIQLNRDSIKLQNQNVYSPTGEKDGKTYRLYFTAYNTEAFVKISFSGTNRFHTQYKIVLMQTKPVVLVHGLRGFPMSNGGSGTDFGNLRNFIGYVNNVRPCVCLQFPWDTTTGNYKDYVGAKNKSGTLFHYLSKSNSFFHARATIMTYSTGGTILYDQMDFNGFDQVMENAVMVAAPFWGVYFANKSHIGGFNWSRWWPFRASQENIKNLSRGTRVNWERHYADPRWPSWLDITVVIGTGNRTNYRPAIFCANFLVKDINEIKDSPYGDGLISIPSANLSNEHNSIKVIKCSIGHNEIVDFNLSNLGDRTEFYNDFVNKINSWKVYYH